MSILECVQIGISLKISLLFDYFNAEKTWMLSPEFVEVVIKDAIKRSFRKCLCLTDRCYTTSKGTKTSCFHR
jgi:hypothetical protein